MLMLDRLCELAVALSQISGLRKEIKGLDGLSGQQLDSFFAYDPAFTGGLFVAARG